MTKFAISELKIILQMLANHIEKVFTLEVSRIAILVSFIPVVNYSRSSNDYLIINVLSVISLRLCIRKHHVVVNARFLQRYISLLFFFFFIFYHLLSVSESSCPRPKGVWSAASRTCASAWQPNSRWGRPSLWGCAPCSQPQPCRPTTRSCPRRISIPSALSMKLHRSALRHSGMSGLE